MNIAIEKLFELQKIEFGPDPESPANQQAIKKLREEIPFPILGHYDRLRIRGKTGVSIVRNDACSECHMKLGHGIFYEVLHTDDVKLCDHCGRYLIAFKEDISVVEEEKKPVKQEDKSAETTTKPKRGRKPKKVAAVKKSAKD